MSDRGVGGLDLQVAEMSLAIIDLCFASCEQFALLIIQFYGDCLKLCEIQTVYQKTFLSTHDLTGARDHC